MLSCVSSLGLQQRHLMTNAQLDSAWAAEMRSSRARVMNQKELHHVQGGPEKTTPLCTNLEHVC